MRFVSRGRGRRPFEDTRLTRLSQPESPLSHRTISFKSQPTKHSRRQKRAGRRGSKYAHRRSPIRGRQHPLEPKAGYRLRGRCDCVGRFRVFFLCAVPRFKVDSGQGGVFVGLSNGRGRTSFDPDFSLLLHPQILSSCLGNVVIRSFRRKGLHFRGSSK